MELKWKPPFFLRLFKLFVTIPQNSRKSRERHFSLLRSEDFFFFKKKHKISEPISYFFNAVNFSMQKFSCDTTYLGSAQTHAQKDYSKKKISFNLPRIFSIFFSVSIFSDWRGLPLYCAFHTEEHNGMTNDSLLRRFPNLQWMTSFQLTGSFCGFITQTYLYPNSI